jgi:hypothetical protein
VPVLYVSSGPWFADVARVRELCPQLVTAQTVGSGHYHQLEVPEQVNAMIDRFLAVALRVPAGTAVPARRPHASAARRALASRASGASSPSLNLP